MSEIITFWRMAELFSPVLVRLLARSGDVPMTDEQIATRSGLSPHQVYLISHQVTWQGVDLFTMRSFLNGCGIDFDDRKRMRALRIYLDRGSCTKRKGVIHRTPPTFKYLRTSPHWQTVFQPLAKLWMQSLHPNPVQSLSPSSP